MSAPNAFSDAGPAGMFNEGESEIHEKSPKCQGYSLVEAPMISAIFSKETAEDLVRVAGFESGFMEFCAVCMVAL